MISKVADPAGWNQTLASSATGADAFATALRDWLNDRRVVTVFNRLHPYIEIQAMLLRRLGDVSDAGHAKRWIAKRHHAMSTGSIWTTSVPCVPADVLPRYRAAENSRTC